MQKLCDVNWSGTSSCDGTYGASGKPLGHDGVDKNII